MKTHPTWRTIDTAPLDGSAVLLARGDEIYVARWLPNEVIGPCWATPDGHAIFRAEEWADIPPRNGLDVRDTTIRHQREEIGKLHARLPRTAPKDTAS